MQRPMYVRFGEILVPRFVGHIFRRHPLDGPCSVDYNCYICDGGLAECIVCENYEGALTTECPGVRSVHLSDAIYNNGLDFKNGIWIQGEPRRVNKKRMDDEG